MATADSESTKRRKRQAESATQVKPEPTEHNARVVVVAAGPSASSSASFAVPNPKPISMQDTKLGTQTLFSQHASAASASASAIAYPTPHAAPPKQVTLTPAVPMHVGETLSTTFEKVDTSDELRQMIQKQKPGRHRVVVASASLSSNGSGGGGSAGSSILGGVIGGDAMATSYVGTRLIRETLQSSSLLEDMQKDPISYHRDPSSRETLYRKLMLTINDINRHVGAATPAVAKPTSAGSTATAAAASASIAFIPLSEGVDKPMDPTVPRPDPQIYTAQYEDMLMFKGGVSRKSPTNPFFKITSPPCARGAACAINAMEVEWIPHKMLTPELKRPFVVMSWMSPTELNQHHATGAVPDRPMGPCIFCIRRELQRSILTHVSDKTNPRGLNHQVWANTNDESGYAQYALLPPDSNGEFNGLTLPVAGFCLKYLRAEIDEKTGCPRINQDLMKFNAPRSGAGPIPTTNSAQAAMVTTTANGGAPPPAPTSLAALPKTASDPKSIFHK